MADPTSDKIRCPHCGTEQWKSPFMTVCSNCLQSLDSEPAPAQPKAEQPAPPAVALPHPPHPPRATQEPEITITLEEPEEPQRPARPAPRRGVPSQWPPLPPPGTLPPVEATPDHPEQQTYGEQPKVTVRRIDTQKKQTVSCGGIVRLIIIIWIASRIPSCLRSYERAAHPPQSTSRTMAPRPQSMPLQPMALPPLHDAAARNDTSRLTALLAGGANVNMKGQKGWTPLHLAAVSGSYDAATVLLDRGADLNAKSDEGRTPLHEAAWNGRANVVQLLIARKANVNAVDNSGGTPLKYAQARNHPDVATILRTNGAK